MRGSVQVIQRGLPDPLTRSRSVLSEQINRPAIPGVRLPKRLRKRDSLSHAIRDLVIDGTCSFTNLDLLKLSRFDGLEKDWREKRGWMPIA